MRNKRIKSNRKRVRKQKLKDEKEESHFSKIFVTSESKFEILSEDQLEQIHNASLQILSQTGIRFESKQALKYFRKAGAITRGNCVFLDQDLIESAINTAPESYTLHARNPSNTITIGNNLAAVMPGGGAPYVIDLNGNRRLGTLSDVENFSRLSQVSPDIHIIARKAVEAQDIDPRIRHLECWQSLLSLSDKPIQSGYPGGRSEAEDVIEMLALAYGGEKSIEGRPITQCSVSVNSPLVYDRSMIESLLIFTRYGQPILISSFVMAGVTGPATLAGTFAQLNAEILAGITLVQIVRPGTPVVYGSATSNVDLRNASPAIGSPESAINIAICAQLARFYNLPSRGGGALTDSPICDVQSNYERSFTLLISFLSGVNFVMHGLGIVGSYMAMSYEQFAIDLELLAMIRHLLQPLDITKETLALDMIDSVGPGGFYLDETHTYRHHRTAHYIPHISIRKEFSQWKEEGGETVLERANRRYRALLGTYKQPKFRQKTIDDLNNFTEKRKQQIQESSGNRIT